MLYNSKDILKMDDLYDIQEIICSSGLTIQYELTEAEMVWLDFVRGHYSIADYIDQHRHNNILTIDSEISIYMDFDCRYAGKAICLSDDAALQKILFWIYKEDQE